jgi:hypothetical protein
MAADQVKLFYSDVGVITGISPGMFVVMPLPRGAGACKPGNKVSGSPNVPALHGVPYVVRCDVRQMSDPSDLDLQ